MKKEFFKNLEIILYEQNINNKFNLFQNFYEDYKNNLFIYDHEQISIIKNNINIKTTHPTKIRRPKFTNTDISLAKIIHSITHIEFSAINLALDAVYRFKNMPKNFYDDWLEVADEEIKHFNLLNDVLNKLNYNYGDFIVHDNLENALIVTKDSLNLRMGVVHRGLEAKGLDANPFVIKKIKTSNNVLKNDLENILKIILNDEIKHVSKGDFWWKYSKKENDDFIKICKTFKEFSLAGKIINKEARLQAGFKEEELIKIQNFYNNK